MMYGLDDRHYLLESLQKNALAGNRSMENAQRELLNETTVEKASRDQFSAVFRHLTSQKQALISTASRF